MLGTEGHETLFLDDIGNNLKGAANFGIITIKVLPYMGQVYECVLQSKHSFTVKIDQFLSVFVLGI